MHDQVFPRVLVICSDGLNYRSGTGIVFSDLFRGWPTDALAQIHADESGPDSQICRLHRRMSVNDVPLDRAFRRILGRGRMAAMGAAFHPLWSDHLEGNLGGASGSRVRLRTSLSAWADCIPYHLNAAFWGWLESFSPEVIFSNLGSIRQIGLAQRVAARLKIPIVPFFNDDWPRTHFQGDALKAFPRWLLLRKLNQLMRNVSVGGAVSVAMAKEYQERYGITFEPFMYCVNAPISPPPPPDGDVVKFCYVGGLHLDRWRSLVELGECLEELRETGLRAKLLVYAPQKDLDRYGQRMSTVSALQVMGTLRADEVHETLVKNHVLVHVESFHSTMRQYTRLSFSTKIPQYLAAGRPVLAYGPEDQAACQYVKETASGIAIGNRQRQMLKSALIRLGSQPGIRKEMGERAWQTALQNHESGGLRERFRAMLASAA